MAKEKSGRRLTKIAGTGMRELPANAAWLLSKALKPAVSASSGASDALLGGRQRVGHRVLGRGDGGRRHCRRAAQDQAAGRSVRAAIPGLGDDSVELADAGG